MSTVTLEDMQALSETIQATSINFISVIRRVWILKASLLSLQSDEKFNEICEITSSAAKVYNLDEPFVPHQRAPKRFDNNSATAYIPPTPEARYRAI